MLLLDYTDYFIAEIALFSIGKQRGFLHFTKRNILGHFHIINCKLKNDIFVIFFLSLTN